MAVPAQLTTLNISGKYSMNKNITDMSKLDEVLRLQGVGWLTRRAIATATIYLDIKHYKDSNGNEHIDIEQSVWGIPSSKEERTLNWEDHEHDDKMFGHVIGKSRRADADDLDIPFLKEGWTAETYQHGIIQSYAQSDTPKSGRTWVANQTWGIQEVDGERRYTRHLDFTGPEGEEIWTVLGYDYLSEL